MTADRLAEARIERDRIRRNLRANRAETARANRAAVAEAAAAERRTEILALLDSIRDVAETPITHRLGQFDLGDLDHIAYHLRAALGRDN